MAHARARKVVKNIQKFEFRLNLSMDHGVLICLLSRSTNALRVNTGHEPCHEEYIEQFMNGQAAIRFIVAQYDSANDVNRKGGRFMLMLNRCGAPFIL